MNFTDMADTHMGKLDEEQYDQKVDVRLTPSQKRAVEGAAKRVGLTASSWVRMVILDKLDWKPPEPED
jgi:uncharacterized protein (DUF1778 family)